MAQKLVKVCEWAQKIDHVVTYKTLDFCKLPMHISFVLFYT